MVIDTSALIAITLGEPARRQLLEHLEAAPKRVISSISLFEAGMVLRARVGESAVYALAESRGEPVLATGNDFAATDLVLARP